MIVPVAHSDIRPHKKSIHLSICSAAKKANLTENPANLSSTPFFMMRYDCVCPSVTFRLFRVYVFIPSLFA
jgi:hypothetical protein